MDGWSYDSLWQKANLYIERALNEDRDGPLFPFWAILALELLARATLAKVHPALLAEPDCLFLAFGYESGTKPKSVMAKTVFLRCQKIVPNFGDEELKICMSMIDRRNEELHTGVLSFDAFPTGLWLSEYFRICKLLLSFQGRSLTQFLGTDEAEAAEKMIVAAEREVLAKVMKTIAQKKSEFEALGSSEQARRTQASEVAVQESTEPSKQRTVCPACGAKALITGEQVRASQPRLVEDTMYTDLAFLPTNFRCFSCELTLNGHSSLHAARMGGQYSVTEAYDPAEYYGERLLAAMAEDAAYMNE